MTATEHLNSYGITPQLKPNGKINLQGMKNLPENIKTEILAWAKDNRAMILRELTGDQKGQKGQKGFETENKATPPTAKSAKTPFDSFDSTPGRRFSENQDPAPSKKSPRRKIRPVTPGMAQRWRAGRQWIKAHMPELLAAGWTRAELLRADTVKFPCGAWGVAWFWQPDKPEPTIDIDGAIRWTWKNETGNKVTQAMRPKNPIKRKDAAMEQDEWAPFIVPEPLEVHPMGEIMPWMTGAEKDGLKDSIQKHGLLEPIVLFQGKILDGKCRYKACQETGATVWARRWEGGGDPVEYVMSANLHRQQLSQEQASSVKAATQTN